MLSYKSRGIVLHTVKYGESSIVAYLYTEHLGRQNYMIQGVRSKRGRGSKGALFQPMFILEFEGLHHSRSELHKMREVRNHHPLTTVPFDPRKSTISLFVAEVLYKLIREVEPNLELFDFISGSIASLDRMDKGVANFHLWFLVSLSRYLGFYPGGVYAKGDWFDIKSGVFTSEMPPHRFAIAPEETELLAVLMNMDAEDIGELELSRARRAVFMEGILEFFGYHFDAVNGIRSLSILREVF